MESVQQANLRAMIVTTQGEAETCKLVSLVSQLESPAGLRRHPSLPLVEEQPVQVPLASRPIPRALAGGGIWEPRALAPRWVTGCVSSPQPQSWVSGGCHPMGAPRLQRVESCCQPTVSAVGRAVAYAERVLRRGQGVMSPSNPCGLLAPMCISKGPGSGLWEAGGWREVVQCPWACC